MNQYADGVWPVMLTPFSPDGEVDHGALAELTRWYIGQGVQGLFATCQSSEIFSLSLRERVSIVETVVKTSNGRVPVIASGHVADHLEGQLYEMDSIMEAGAHAFVLISNRLARQEEGDSVWLKNLDVILSHAQCHDINLGMYECPYPYKRLLNDATLCACAHSGSFYFLKDTCCDADLIKKRLGILKDTSMKLYNANTATLLSSLRAGAAGFSGIMANFHPKLYVWLAKHSNHEHAQRVQDALSVMGMLDRYSYPSCAKYHLSAIEGIPMTIKSRVQNELNLTQADKQLVQAVERMSHEIYKRYCGGEV